MTTYRKGSLFSNVLFKSGLEGKKSRPPRGRAVEIRKTLPLIYCIGRIPFPLQLGFTRHRFCLEEEVFMTYCKTSGMMRRDIS